MDSISALDYVVTGDEMAQLEQIAEKKFRVPPALLMERAGYETSGAVKELLSRDVHHARIHVICGRGKNGGDGFVAARHLHNEGARVKVWMIGDPATYQGLSAQFQLVAKAAGVSMSVIDDESFQRFTLSLRTSDVIVDALIGSGLKGDVRPLQKKVIQAVNDSGRPVLAVDIPSGVHSDTGKAPQGAIQAHTTVTFSLRKTGHLFGPGRSLTGRLHVADIGLPSTMFQGKDRDPTILSRIYVDGSWAQTHLRPRPEQAHKGTFGRLLIVGGSFGMAGAVALAARGALRAGVGIVQCLVPDPIVNVVQQLVPEAIAVPLPHKEGRLTEATFDRLKSAVKPGDVVSIGPGMGRSHDLDALVNRVYTELRADVVVDADGLNALAQAGGHQRRHSGSHLRVLTPHPKEGGRLLGQSTKDITDDPLGAARRLYERYGAMIVLKGSTTVVQNVSKGLYVNGSGDVSLATAGTGDVLTGVIGAMLAQRYSPSIAVPLGVYVHGRAGEIVGETMGRHGSMAGDVADAVGTALFELEHRMVERRSP